MLPYTAKSSNTSLPGKRRHGHRQRLNQGAQPLSTLRGVRTGRVDTHTDAAGVSSPPTLMGVVRAARVLVRMMMGVSMLGLTLVLVLVLVLIVSVAGG